MQTLLDPAEAHTRVEFGMAEAEVNPRTGIANPARPLAGV
jgi:hypothetical protein